MSVPITALISATATDATNVSFSAATACGSVIASQKLRSPCVDFQTTAASGTRTISVR
jgi:hypothetical protein